MKNKFLAISLLISYHALILHDMIPHHHQEHNDTEIVNDHFNSIKHSSDETDHHMPIPAHQHLSAAEDFNIIRIQQSFIFKAGIIISIYIQCPDIYNSLISSRAVQLILWPIFKIPLSSYPFLISPNAMRGSPSNI